MKRGPIRELILYELEPGHKTAEGEGAVDHSTEIWLELQEPWRSGKVNFAEALWFRDPCFKPWKQIWQVAYREYQESSASNRPVWFIIFTAPVKASAAVKLCLKYIKYCKTFDSPEYIKNKKLKM